MLFILYITVSLLIILALDADRAEAAVIKGTAYDPNLNPVKDVLIEINTTPSQRYVAKDGTFLFSLPVGIYNVSAFFETQNEIFQARETIYVSDDGRYLRDLFLISSPKFPQLPASNEEKSNYEIYKPYFLYGGGIIAGLLIIGTSYFLVVRTVKHDEQDKGSHASAGAAKADHQGDAKKESEGDAKEIIVLLKKNNGRMTQKDIRKEIPLSEAKISLMVSELEEQGIVKKIKKGRGNIIILK